MKSHHYLLWGAGIYLVLGFVISPAGSGLTGILTWPRYQFTTA